MRATRRRAWSSLLLVAALLTACDRDEKPPVAVASATTAAATAGAAPIPVASPARTAAATGTPAVAAAALDGLRCVGRWENQTFRTSGAFALRIEGGGGGGEIAFEVGGSVFGGQGGIFRAPFRIDGNTLVIDAHSDFLGHVIARVGLDGRAEGILQGPPALGPRAEARVVDFRYAEGQLRFTLRIDFGDGRAPATSTVDAVCTRG